MHFWIEYNNSSLSIRYLAYVLKDYVQPHFIFLLPFLFEKEIPNSLESYTQGYLYCEEEPCIRVYNKLHTKM